MAVHRPVRLPLPSFEGLALPVRTLKNVRAQAGVDLSALQHTDLSVPQAWGLAVQHHLNSFDGLLYAGRFDGQPCLALFDRPGLRDGLSVISTVDLLASEEANAFLSEKRVALI